MTKRLIIMRGAPGSGKSFVARELAKLYNGVICSTDDFFTDSNGNYNFDPNKIVEFHQANQSKVHNFMDNGAPVIIVDNTNILRSHMNPYEDLAKEHGYAVEYRHVKCDVETCIARNTHRVPAEIIRKMVANFEE